MKKTIAIVAGGDSSEHGVSLHSAEGLYSFMDHEKYNVYVIEMTGLKWEAILADGTKTPIDRNDFSFDDHGTKVIPDLCYITIHGQPGENGLLQGYFDLIHMPYSTSDVLVEAMTFDKYVLNNYLRGFGVKVADSVLIRHGESYSTGELIARIGLPCFVKPAADGSSFGVSRVNTAEELTPAIEKANAEGGDVMVEGLLEGTEISCGIYKTKTKSVPLPITEVVSEDEFFDYEAKYQGKVKEITPARLSPETTDKVHQEVSRIYDILHAKGIIRIDFIVSHKNGVDQINMLEINTTPGMTATSFIPQQVRAAGLDIKDVLSEIIEDILANKTK